MRPHYLNPLFAPRSIAMFGASEREDSVGQVVFRNLLQAGFKGSIHAVNPAHRTVQGEPCHPDLVSIGEPVDLAIVATPARTVPAIVEACGEHGVKAMIILSAGFREVGAAGRQLEERVLETANNHGIRILGPNCLGLIRPDWGLNATFGNNNARPGNLALVSQSGALCTAILDWAEQRHIGFSAVISTGIAADLDFGDILDYLVTDPRTDSILLYVEGLQDARRFMTGLRAAARAKPVIAIKVGRHGEGAQASMSHTGALVGGDDAFSAALARSGVVRVQTINQLFAAADTLASRYRGCGNRLAIVTNGGGPGVFAADHVADLGLQLAALADDTLQALDKHLPATWSHGNPVDVIGDATPERYAAAVDLCLRDPGVDGVVVILTPQAMTRPLAVAEALVELADEHRKPVFTVWMGGEQVESARDAFRSARIPCFTTPEAAVDAVHYLAAYQANQKLLLQVPPKSLNHQGEPDIDAARLIIEGALGEQRKVLSEPESIALLDAFLIPSVRNGIARSPEEALVLATSIGFPVVMKVYSQDISHKSDVGGVLLNITTAQAVRGAYRELLEQVQRNRPEARIEGVTVEKMYRSRNGRELMIGVISDQVFGPVISFGSGGTAVEVMQDSAVSLPPLNNRLAHDLIDRTRVARMLGEYRHMPPARLDALVDVLLRVSTMACELPWLKEMDINPLILDEHGIVAVDARIRVDFPRASTDPYHHMAIHPYPAHLVTRYQLPNGTDITIRPIRPEDAEIEQDFIRNLSEQSRYFRFMQNIHELTPQMLTRFTQIDYDQEMALIAVTEQEGQEEELAVGRYVTNSDGVSCEFALVVSDKWQRLGIGHRLMSLLIRIARDRGLESMEGEVLSGNTKMLGLMKSLDFRISNHPDDVSIQVVSKVL
jgi:acetyltransferase